MPECQRHRPINARFTQIKMSNSSWHSDMLANGQGQGSDLCTVQTPKRSGMVCNNATLVLAQFDTIETNVICA